MGYGNEWYVRYPNAYADIGADLIYLVWHGRVPRLQKLVRFNTALASDRDFNFTYSYSDDQEFTSKESAKWDKKAKFNTNKAVRLRNEMKLAPSPRLLQRLYFRNSKTRWS